MDDPWDDDDEDWYDDDSSDGGADDGPDISCPECGAAIPALADKCPACGYWLIGADRLAAPGAARPLWLRITALVVLVAFLLSVLGIAAQVF